MAYPAKYYQMQRDVMSQIRWSHSSGLCPVCKQRPSATWPDGSRRITCGSERCFIAWLPVRGDGHHQPEHE